MSEVILGQVLAVGQGQQCFLIKSMTYSYFWTQFILVLHFGKFPNVKKPGSAPEINFLADIRTELKRRLLDTIKKSLQKCLNLSSFFTNFLFRFNKNIINDIQ